MKRWRKILIAGLAVSAAGAVLSMFASRWLVERIIYSQLPKEQQKEYKIWRSEKIDFRPDDLRVAPFQPATVRAGEKFRQEWADHQYQACRISGVLLALLGNKIPECRDGNALYLIPDTSSLDSLMQSFEALVDQPDYELDAQSAGLDPVVELRPPRPDVVPIHATARVMLLSALNLVARDRPAEALERIQTVVRATRTPRLSPMINHIIALNLLSDAAQTWNLAILGLKDPAVLRASLAWENDLGNAMIPLAGGAELITADHVGAIRQIMRFGVAAKVGGLTGQEIMAGMMRAEADFRAQRVLPNLKDPRAVSVVREEIALNRIAAGEIDGKAKGRLALPAWWSRPIVGSILFTANIPNNLHPRMVDATARAHVDLMRLNTARRLYLLENGREPARAADLRPKYLTQIPRDVFSKENNAYQKNVVFYSVGPDAADQQGCLAYDPTNGTYSTGDILMTGK